MVDTDEDGESYSVTEQATEGWNLTNAYCFKGSDIVVGKNVEQDSLTVTVNNTQTFIANDGDKINCAFYNTKVTEVLQCNPEVNLLENGSFENPELSSGSWDIILNTNPLLKWLVSWTNPQTTGQLGLEIQNNVAGAPSEGSQHAELDGDHPVTISQTIPTIVGETYNLSFDYSARPGRDAADNTIEVREGTNLLGTLADDGTSLLNTFWNGENYSFVATSDSTTIEFKDIGTDTSFGGYLDNVSLNCNPEPIQQCNANATSVVVSDSSTQVDSGDAELLTPIHEAWTASIPGASWIWSTNPIVGPTNDADNTEVFIKTFNIVGTPTGGTLDIAADNNYSVKVNGTSVPVVFNQNNFQAGTQDTYNVLPMLVSGLNILEITVTNLEIGQDPNPANNPAGLLYKLSLTNNECIVPPPPILTSTVTMCKQNADIPVGDVGYYPMPGWTLTLTGDSIEDLSVPSNTQAGVSTVNPLVAGASYVAKAVGTWLNQSGANPADAEYSTTDSWATQMDGYTGYQSDILELQIDNKFDPNSSWGAYNSLHTYAQSFVPTGTSSNFRIFDGTGTTQNEGWFGDNSGALSVNISKGFAGITQGFDTANPGPGCVTFTDVPYGTYTAGEIMQDGWQNVSGLGTVTVDTPTEEFIVLNEQIPASPTTLKVHIYKYLKNGEVTAQIPNDSTAPAFPMTSSWSADNIGTASGAYFLGDYHGQGTLKYAADTSAMSAPADYTTSETVGDLVVPTNSESCPAGKYRLLGYKSGTSLESAEESALSAIAPVYTDITTDQYVIVINEKCPDVLGETATSNTTVVTPSSMAGWLFVQETPNGTGQMMIGPGTAPLGMGSAQLTVDAAGGELLATAYTGVPFSDMKTLVYSTYRTAGGAALAPSIQINIDTDTTDAVVGWQGRLVYEPYYTQIVTTGAWQTWNAFDDLAGSATGNWWFSNGTIATNTGCTQANPCTWAEVKTALPNGGIHGTLGGIGFKAGSNWAGGFDGNVDKLVLGIKTGLNTHTETYDFEPATSESLPACSDESDNDEDSLSDSNDPGCHTDGNVNNPESYDPEDNSESNSATQCSDGLSNDDDGLVDSNDPGCLSGDGHVWNPADNDESDDSNGGGGGGGGSSSNSPNGQVLGATSTCGIYVDKYLRRGYMNDVEAVKKVQKFLNDYMQAGLKEDGVFGLSTENALKKFQLAHADKILTPWGFSKPTGIFYITTQTEVNNIMCPELMLKIPELVPIALNPLAPKRG